MQPQGILKMQNSKDEEILVIAVWASVDGLDLCASVTSLQLEEIQAA